MPQVPPQPPGVPVGSARATQQSAARLELQALSQRLVDWTSIPAPGVHPAAAKIFGDWFALHLLQRHRGTDLALLIELAEVANCGRERLERLDLLSRFAPEELSWLRQLNAPYALSNLSLAFWQERLPPAVRAVWGPLLMGQEAGGHLELMAFLGTLPTAMPRYAARFAHLVEYLVDDDLGRPHDRNSVARQIWDWVCVFSDARWQWIWVVLRTALRRPEKRHACNGQVVLAALQALAKTRRRPIPAHKLVLLPELGPAGVPGWCRRHGSAPRAAHSSHSAAPPQEPQAERLGGQRPDLRR